MTEPRPVEPSPPPPPPLPEIRPPAENESQLAGQNNGIGQTNQAAARHPVNDMDVARAVNSSNTQDGKALLAAHPEAAPQVQEAALRSGNWSLYHEASQPPAIQAAAMQAPAGPGRDPAGNPLATGAPAQTVGPVAPTAATAVPPASATAPVPGQVDQILAPPPKVTLEDFGLASPRVHGPYQHEVPAAAATPADAMHMVVPGDTLWGISEQSYGQGTQWPRIHEANREQVSNPDLIYPDQVLRIPGAGTAPATVPPAPTDAAAAGQAPADPPAGPGCVPEERTTVPDDLLGKFTYLSSQVATSPVRAPWNAVEGEKAGVQKDILSIAWGVGTLNTHLQNATNNRFMRYQLPTGIAAGAIGAAMGQDISDAEGCLHDNMSVGERITRDVTAAVTQGVPGYFAAIGGGKVGRGLGEKVADGIAPGQTIAKVYGGGAGAVGGGVVGGSAGGASGLELAEETGFIDYLGKAVGNLRTTW